MALPPRFPGLIPGYGVQIPPMTTFVSAPSIIDNNKLQPQEKPPVTTVFVGNINEKCTNELIRSILNECGAVATWKRIQGSNGKFQAFGFCEFENPFGTMRALRILHDYPLAEKKLVVKIDDKTRSMVRDFVTKKRVEKGLMPETLAVDELPADEENLAEDEEVRQKILNLIEGDAPSLLPIEGEIKFSKWFRFMEGELEEKTHSPVSDKSVGRERKDRSSDRRREKKVG
ncbi:unnamed protein product [Dracunculus medinensis]|uniref:RRM domain-containing protein n=1 Tax=Dracunculus medinensis TaxID=318479 RepID=A0A0N4UML7_DRAME|nr:unnamed protein product [Dracunculus medinensis]